MVTVTSSCHLSPRRDIAVLCTVFPMLCISSLWLIYFATGSLFLLIALNLLHSSPTPKDSWMLFFPIAVEYSHLKNKRVYTRMCKRFIARQSELQWAFLSWSVYLCLSSDVFCLSLTPAFGSEWVTVRFDLVLIHQNQVSYKWWNTYSCVVRAAWRHQPHAKACSRVSATLPEE